MCAQSGEFELWKERVGLQEDEGFFFFLIFGRTCLGGKLLLASSVGGVEFI